eukprot:CAMPEP_0204589138 /NCGR_PEP_ID=MMETSP0661-20131031/49031_1 /ASSEMBLY_ACC=CAM_ASM_000606 /TAXON_ID=109239 /ORGANISM="Alexandrium margalefi, Strain AMGDE01CS-322" /LENGTH=67 /DNA_ID=CAMNT_0051599033 /DNA_START=12 /DNA_END=212 /DNA_ORIENTATION=+
MSLGARRESCTGDPSRGQTLVVPSEQVQFARSGLKIRSRGYTLGANWRRNNATDDGDTCPKQARKQA